MRKEVGLAVSKKLDFSKLKRREFRNSSVVDECAIRDFTPSFVLKIKKKTLPGMRHCANKLCSTFVKIESEHLHCRFHRGISN